MVTMGGVSRAAKKRAKKKQKLLQVDPKNTKDAVEKLEEGDDDISPSRQEPEHDSSLGRVSLMNNTNEKKRPREEDGEDSEYLDSASAFKSKNTNHAMTHSNGEEEDDESIMDKEDEEPTTSAKVDTRKKKSQLTAPPDEQVTPPSGCSSLLEIVQPDPSLAELTGLSARQRANCSLNFLLQPAEITTHEFMEEYWEKQALLIQQSSSKHRHRFDGFLSLQQIKDMLANNRMYYGRDLNVTRYEKDKHGVMRRTTLDLIPSSSSVATQANEAGDQDGDRFVEADSELVWTHYQKGCTVRLLCPHKNCDPVQALLHMIELELGCMVGANAYLTPPESSQGFAPHYDDIEAFCLQLQGRKRWKVYRPLNKGETLPRQSSPDYVPDDLADVKPVMDVVLSPGDVLYMPRGWIHQACTLPGGKKDDGHSLHLTVSAMQQWAWVDLLEIVLPEALEAAAASETSTALREGLPVRFLDYMGAAYANRHVPELLKGKLEEQEQDQAEMKMQQLQEEFRNQAKARIMRVAKEAMDLLDASCDQISKQFLSSCQPPALSKAEVQATSAGHARTVEIEPGMLVRLVRPGIARLVLEDDKAVVYHCLDNSREYHGNPMSPLEFELDDGPALEQLLQTTEPHWIGVESLFHDTIEDKVGVTQSLYDEGLLMVRG